MQNDRTPQNQQLAAGHDYADEKSVCRVGQVGQVGRLGFSLTILSFDMLESLCHRNPVVVPYLCHEPGTAASYEW